MRPIGSLGELKPVREVRRRLARSPLWLRLVVLTLLLVALAITLTGGFAVQLLRGYLVDRVDHQLEVAIRLWRDPALPPAPRPQPADSARAARQFGLYYMALVRRDGNVRQTLQENPDADPPRLSLVTLNKVGTRPRHFTVVSEAGTSWRVIARTNGAEIWVIAIGMNDIDGTVARLQAIVAGVGGGVLVILGFACHWLVRRSLRPLGEIERTAGAIAGGDLSRRVPLRHRRTEMGRLGRAINGMLAQIEAAFQDREASEIAARKSAFEARRSEDRMRRFVADASHELRTPLTSIRGFAELYRHESPDLEEAARLVRRIEDEAARMGLLVDDLLLLARLDQRRPIERRPVDMLSLAAGAVLDAQTLAPHREIELVRLDDSEGSVTVMGDEARLHQVIGNLVGNALRHTPDGTAFRVGVGDLGGQVVVEVADEGPGLPPNDTERVFERFYRADPSRTRNGGGGSGLGLSIVAALVQAHGGEITVDSRPGRGATFHVVLPGGGRPASEPDRSPCVDTSSPSWGMTPCMRGNDGLFRALETLRRRLDPDLFPLVIGDVAAHRHALRELRGQLDDYLLPRVAAMDAPLLAVVGGSTGAGKSTLVNSLACADVTEPGVLRPTTLAPTLVANPADQAWFMRQSVLPGLARTTGGGRGEPGTLRVVTTGTLPAGLALLDAPDIDSIVTANREIATKLLAAADLWLFVTTAARYADEVPWGFLRSARERSTALAVVLDRVPPEALVPVFAHLSRLLDANGLAGTPLFIVPEAVLAEENCRLPEEAVRAVRDWLGAIAADTRVRGEVVRRTLSGALESLTARVPALADEADRQRAGLADLRLTVESAYGAAMTAFDDGIRDGSLLRGEVLARWQDFIGTGDFMRSLESRIGWVRERIVSAFTGRPAPETQLKAALSTGVEALIRSAADAAAERALEAWSGTAAGRDLLERAGVVSAGRLGRASPTLPERARSAVRAWQGYVLELVAKEGADRRTTARLASFGVNGAGLLLMLMVFASTGGLTGIEVGIAGGTSVLSQKLLEAVFGDQAVRTLTQAARENLRERVRALFDEESARFTALLDGLGPAEDATAALRQAAQAVRDHRGEIGAPTVEAQVDTG